ncbi:MAG TPA: hypothetical protein VFV58_07140 [Blastocatellia bacterium]|jgi:hypothetical protein|nr:hypothetical protein [Blastocatellia bacterium]
MNSTLEQKMNELMEEADRQGAGAAYVVPHLLLGNYLNGSHREFAKHCCRFSPIQMRLTSSVSTSTEDPWDDAPGAEYVN